MDTALRSSGSPIIGGYWFQPLTTASAAFASTSSGNGPSGNPWPRLTASCSRASRDITSNTETGRLAKTEFMDVSTPSCPAMTQDESRLGRQPGRLPGLDAAGKVGVVGQA